MTNRTFASFVGYVAPIVAYPNPLRRRISDREVMLESGKNQTTAEQSPFAQSVTIANTQGEAKRIFGEIDLMQLYGLQANYTKQLGTNLNVIC